MERIPPIRNQISGRNRKAGEVMQRLGENYTSIGQMADQLLQKKPVAGTTDSRDSTLSFQEILSSARESRTEGLRFSKHANERLVTRNIQLTGNQMERLENGASRARAKGIQESLVMVDNLAFIVNVQNNTVITAMDDSADSVFTNIDGAVIS